MKFGCNVVHETRRSRRFVWVSSRNWQLSRYLFSEFGCAINNLTMNMGLFCGDIELPEDKGGELLRLIASCRYVLKIMEE